jgi:AbrB family looped-hinge helix DNA binding protein
VQEKEPTEFSIRRMKHFPNIGIKEHGRGGEEMKRALRTGCVKAKRPIVTKIVSKFQITIPLEIRALYDLREGDVFEWIFDRKTASLTLVPKRAQLITPQVESQVENIRASREKLQEKDSPVIEEQEVGYV